MNEKRTTTRELHDADGLEDWRVLFSGGTPADQAEASVAAALAAGGRLADASHAPHRRTLASPENPPRRPDPGGRQ